MSFLNQNGTRFSRSVHYVITGVVDTCELPKLPKLFDIWHLFIYFYFSVVSILFRLKYPNC